MNLELFQPEPKSNLLPFDGVVEDYGLMFSPEESEKCFAYFLQHLDWEQDEVYLFGKYHRTDRKIAWYGDALYPYHYSGMQKQGRIWPAALRRLNEKVQHMTGHQFNSCLANLYEHGEQGMGWHSDDEKTLLNHNRECVIASLSFGATRKFAFKHKTQPEKVELMLQSGQLIVMKGQTQQYWKHSLLKSKKILQPRINFTFRYFYAKD